MLAAKSPGLSVGGGGARGGAHVGVLKVLDLADEGSAFVKVWFSDYIF